MANPQPYRIKTITDYHRVTGLPKPEHPLISVINVETIQHPPGGGVLSLMFDFYSISLKKGIYAKFKYGQQAYDFDEGVMFFMSPGQVFGFEIDSAATRAPSGWMVLIHPDFLWNTPLAKKIKQYEYFSYSVNEALYLSDKEETMVTGIAQYIEQEYHSNIDNFSQDIIISQLEVLLNYSERFYHRQFLTRKISNNKTLSQLEDILTKYFEGGDLIDKGLPTVQYVADTLNVSANYLSRMLTVLTGQSTQQHIHDKLIEKAKEKLSTSDLSVSEIAYALGFEHSQSFSKMFKSKTSLSPLEFRNTFN